MMCAIEPLGQYFGHVERSTSREVGDLLPAGDAHDGDYRIVRLFEDFREQTIRPHLARNLVVFRLVAEGAGHPAASGAAFLDLATGSAQQGHRVFDTDERLLMAMAVEENAWTRIGSPGELRAFVFHRPSEEFVDEEAAFGNGGNVRTVR